MLNWKIHNIETEQKNPFSLWAKASKNPEWHRKYGILKKEEKEYWNLAKNEILLGCVDQNYTVPAKFEWDGKSLRICVFGLPGTGKTQLITWLIEQLHIRYNIDVLVVSPKPQDYLNINKPQNKQNLIEHLKYFGFEPRGMNATIVTLKWLNINEKLGTNFKEYVPSLIDFGVNDTATLLDTFAEFFEVLPRTPEYRSLAHIIHKSKDLPINIKKFENKIKQEIRDRAEGKILEDVTDLDGFKLKRGYYSTAFLVKFQQWVDANIIGDKNIFNFPIELRKSGFLIYQLTQNAGRQNTLSVCIKLPILNIMADRTKVMTSNGNEGVLKRPIIIAFDEAHKIAPRRYNTPAKLVARSLVTEGRSIGITSIFATQDPSKLDDTIIRESNLIFLPKIDDAIKKVLIDTGTPLGIIKELETLRRKEGEIPEWAAYFTETKKLIRFNPLHPLSAMSEEQTALNLEENQGI